MTDIRLPSITATTQEGALEQLRSYLFQLAQQLNWALGTLEKQAEDTARQVSAAAAVPDEAESAQAAFAQVKSLIIKSAEIVDAYYAQISARLEGKYVAQSDFGTFTEQTAATLTATAQSIQTLFENTQTIRTDAGSTTILGAEAWVKIGIVDYDSQGFPIYGMEIGQVNSRDGGSGSKKIAQYRSDGVFLYDQNGVAVATISNNTLTITNAVIRGTLQLGGYAVTTANGLAFKWVGRG